ncbi:aminotransferase class V-fold PLP-dependent enzyme [Patescibacteria group bacterium]|nr:aminotransferase class V-fold PLP-dependent enzyme [Patescibacteria group bacterium]MBU1500804.1 aminotransferase class V-fold PLP-dependent enzyme [Patescibacteria group bacterium]MBU2080859.1 aminotransferase class V-fold PLP-dependent enzyme [Patescibacteria group bacterium]MBU2123964.1 aminotransferase class V-fold PLP-dependent enzyme [Patescibacteria group bacterium]MBU2194745.1 aminotransferase class V-fold PLP-dependent enzyme [Patescibacteria group bacterium]
MFSKRRTYLDWAASAPISQNALAAFHEGVRLYGNPSSPHAEGLQARELLNDARTRIARLASVKSDAVLFTAGATEANALAIQGYLEKKLSTGISPSDMHVLYLETAHSSTQGAIKFLKEKGVVCEPLPLKDFAIDIEKTKKLVRPATVLIATELVCGETGTRYAVRDLKRALETAGIQAHLHVDATQAPFEESIELTRLGADSLSLDAQKVGGVRGIGVLIIPRPNTLAPLIRGGGQEQGIRPGTESPALAHAFATALEGCSWKEFAQTASSQRALLLKRIQDAIPDVLINEGKEQAMHILNISLSGVDTDYLVALLDEDGFAVSTKSACETEALGSRVVELVTGDAERAASTLRISWGPSTKNNELELFSRALVPAVRFVRENRV